MAPKPDKARDGAESATDQRTQVERFRDLARELDADEDEKRFEDQVRRIAPKSPPSDAGPSQED
jgi:hypothetical protein